MKSPRISICVPVHNSEIWFAQCIESIECQTLKDWEIIVVDDASKDGIKKLYDHYHKKLGDKFKVFKFPKNQGIAKTRNFAVAQAEGEIICVQDADDMSQKERLERTWNYFKRHKKIDLVYGGYMIVDCMDKPTRELPGVPFDYAEMLRHNYIAHPTVAYRKKSFDKVKYREECDVIDDWFLYHDFVQAGFDIGHIEEVIAFHRELATGASLDPKRKDRVLAMREKFVKETSAYLPSLAN
jgi:teichuronic acid biosynthesis glycosyltransferase TuaG